MLAHITAWLLAYRYWAMVPIALWEAPLLSIVVGFLAATGYLNVFLSFPILVGGDLIGDTALYSVGRWGGPVLKRLGRPLKLQPERVRKVVAYFEKRDRLAIIVSKLVHGVGFTGLVVAGGARVPYGRFIGTCFLVSGGQSAALIAAGMLSGKAYQSLAQYLGYFDFAAAIAVLAAVFFLYRLLLRNIGEDALDG